jgi:hypothetical protein
MTSPKGQALAASPRAPYLRAVGYPLHPSRALHYIVAAAICEMGSYS